VSSFVKEGSSATDYITDVMDVTEVSPMEVGRKVRVSAVENVA
jgi:hypothetical protein